jgi:hypothetical protein
MYSCDAAQHIEHTDIIDILRTSRTNNAAHGITGILFYRDGRFLQILQGSEESVIALSNTIRADTRQRDFTILMQAQAPELFAGWAMDYCKLNDKSVALDEQGEGKRIPAWIPEAIAKAPLRIRKAVVCFGADKRTYTGNHRLRISRETRQGFRGKTTSAVSGTELVLDQNLDARHQQFA